MAKPAPQPAKPGTASRPPSWRRGPGAFAGLRPSATPVVMLKRRTPSQGQ